MSRPTILEWWSAGSQDIWHGLAPDVIRGLYGSKAESVRLRALEIATTRPLEFVDVLVDAAGRKDTFHLAIPALIAMGPEAYAPIDGFLLDRCLDWLDAAAEPETNIAANKMAPFVAAAIRLQEVLGNAERLLAIGDSH